MFECLCTMNSETPWDLDLGWEGQFVIAMQKPESCQSCLNGGEGNKKSNARKHLLGIVLQLLS